MSEPTTAAVEEVARIIDPTAWILEDGFWVEQLHADAALAKARRILALPSVGWRTIDSAPRTARE